MATEISKVPLLILVSFLLIPSSSSSSIPHSFIHCLAHKFQSNISILSVLYSPHNSSFTSIFESSIQNHIFLTSPIPKPLAIITPLDDSHVQATVICCKQNGLQIRIRSGGHDYEGLSYISKVPFVILDLRNLRAISIDIEDGSAWVEPGATLGEVYYSIAKKSPIHGFPAGLAPTVGTGGHFSGGGVGNLIRKYGLSSDNVIDVRIVDVHGRILDRKSMGSDLFWAIRGSDGASFGVIVAFKIKLAHVPPVVSVLNVVKTFEQGAIDIIHKWQYIGHKLSEDLLFRIVISGYQNGTVRATCYSFFLGRTDEHLKIIEENFPEIHPRKQDFIEMSWIESVLYFAEYNQGQTLEALKNRTDPFASSFKGKTDLVYQPLSYEALEELWKRCLGANISALINIQLYPFGGRMDEISESETPFPHRKGVIYAFVYAVQWTEDEDAESSQKNINWIRGLEEFLTPYVSKAPRGAILTGRDLDLGANDVSGTTYSKAKIWGSRYFKKNFKRLAIIKGEVDPDSFFYHEQSIPPLVSHA